VIIEVNAKVSSNAYRPSWGQPIEAKAYGSCNSHKRNALGPTVGRASQKCPYYQTKPDLTSSGQLSLQKAQHSPSSWTRMLNPTAWWPTNHDRLPVRVIRTH